MKVFLLALFPFSLPLSNSYVRADESVPWYRFYLLPVTKLVTWTLSCMSLPIRLSSPPTHSLSLLPFFSCLFLHLPKPLQLKSFINFSSFYIDLVFLGLLSYSVMEASIDSYGLQWHEFFLWGWVACVLIEEFEQFRTSEGIYFYISLFFLILNCFSSIFVGTYIKNLSNQIDVIRNLGLVICIFTLQIFCFFLFLPLFSLLSLTRKILSCEYWRGSWKKIIWRKHT